MDKQKIDYYGSSEINSVSYLEFGSIDKRNDEKKIWGYWQDQNAYDLYMFSRYARDLFAFRKFLQEKTVNIEKFNEYVEMSAHVKILDYIFKYVGLIVALKSDIRGGVCESGSSLYGLIDEAIALDKVLHDSENEDLIRSTYYIASDISSMMNEGAKALHSDIEIIGSTAPTIKELMKEISDTMNRSLALFYGLSVSMRYALRQSEDILSIAKITKLSVYNRLSFSYGNTYSTVYGTGKAVYIISLPEVIEQLERGKFHAFYCTANMQFNKDGNNSVRASVIISEDKNLIDHFILEYEFCVKQCGNRIEQGEWRPLKMLMQYAKESGVRK